MKVSGRIFSRRSFDRTADPNLAFEFHPIKSEGGVWVRFQVPAFLALVVGKETEAALVDSLEQNDANRRFSIGAGGGEAHRVYIADIGSERGGEPGAELLDWI